MAEAIKNNLAKLREDYGEDKVEQPAPENSEPHDSAYPSDFQRFLAPPELTQQGTIVRRKSFGSPERLNEPVSRDCALK